MLKKFMIKKFENLDKYLDYKEISYKYICHAEYNNNNIESIIYRDHMYYRIVLDGNDYYSWEKRFIRKQKLELLDFLN